MDGNIYEKAKKKTKDYYAKAGVAAGGHGKEFCTEIGCLKIKKIKSVRWRKY